MNGGRRVVLVAAAGWYLLMPPAGDKLSAPLSSWDHVGAFDTAKECEDGKYEVTKRAKDRAEKKVAALIIWARCVASDDPRSKQ